MDPFIGEIIMFAGTFAPRGWAFCDGQLLPIAANQALFSIVGTTYGGDGRTTFALPDLRCRVPVHPGTGPGLSTRRLGQRAGVEEVTLITTQMPTHNHIAIPSTAGGTANINATAVLHADSTGASNDPTGKFSAIVPNIGLTPVKAYGSTADITMNAGAVTVTGTVDLGTIPAPTIGNSGGQQSHTNMQPFECVNFIIAMVSTYPSRS
jgi:microcystin-dependent protein